MTSPHQTRLLSPCDHVTYPMIHLMSPPPSVDRMTHACESITFGRFATRVVNIKMLIIKRLTKNKEKVNMYVVPGGLNSKINYFTWYCYRAQMKLVQVMTSRASVCTLPLPWTYDLGTLPPSLYPLLLTSGGDHWRPVETCSLDDVPTPILTPSCGH